MKKYAYYILVSKDGMEIENRLFLLRRELSSLDIRPQVIRPPQSAALPTSIQTCDKFL